MITSGCAINCSNNSEVFSFHTSGANAVYGDGSARFLKKNVSLATLYKLCARGDGQILGNDAD